MVPLISLVDEQVGEEQAVNEFDDLHELSHDDAASNVDENNDIFEDPRVTKMPNESPSNQHAAKRSRLENVIGKITSNVEYSISFNQSVIDKLHNDSKNNKTVAVEFTRSCFNEMLDDEGFLRLFSSAVDFKPNCLRKLLSNSQPKKRNSSKLPLSCFQEICNFWLKNSITSTDSTNNMKRISRKTFLQQ